jgi:hypothetical protein
MINKLIYNLAYDLYEILLDHVLIEEALSLRCDLIDCIYNETREVI